MKILHIINAGYESGGVECGILETHNYFKLNGHNEKILSSNIRPELPHFSDYEFKVVNPSNPFKFIFNLFNPYAFFKLKQVLHDYKPDIVHLHNIDKASPSVLFLLNKYPTIVSLHGPEIYIKQLLLWCLMPTHFHDGEYNKEKLTITGKLHYIYHVFVQRYLYLLGFNNVDLFIVHSDYILNYVKNDLKPIVKIKDYIKILNFKKYSENYNLLFVGRIEKVKGIDVLIKAMSLIIKKYPNAKLTIVGEGEFKKEIDLLTKKLNLTNNISFIGSINHNNIQKYYHQSSIVLMPSIWPEAFGKVGLEAMSTGRPIIASRVGGIPEWLENGETGYLVDPGVPEQIAEKVIKLLSDRELLVNMGRKARYKAEEYSVDKYVNEIENIYTNIINKYKK